MVRLTLNALLVAVFVLGNHPALAANSKKNSKQKPVRQEASAPKDADGVAEARLIEIYKLVGLAHNREALAKADRLVEDYPHFQLAQLVHGDLLASQVRPLKAFGDVPSGASIVANTALEELREESARRVKALRERPASGTIPSQFLALSQKSRHAIAVDASRSRLYLFENSPAGLALVADYYISVGKAGTAKTAEGDQRTPLGVYYITSNLDPKSLKDFYGSGALPINYPNILDSKRGKTGTAKTAEGDQRTPLGVYYITSNLDPKSLKDFYGSGALPINYPNILDSKRGKTGSGIWLHGTPPNQFSRPPQATDGCVVLANPDLQHIIRTVEVRTTPVVIATELTWVAPHSTRLVGKPFEDALNAWRNAKASGNLQQVLSYYTPDFTSNGKTLTEWTSTLKSELDQTHGRTIQLKDLSYLRWTDAADTMVVTFGEVADGTRIGWTKRQYWIRQENQWKIFFEGVI